jgi:hypothetical protein
MQRLDRRLLWKYSARQPWLGVAFDQSNLYRADPIRAKIIIDFGRIAALSSKLLNTHY